MTLDWLRKRGARAVGVDLSLEMARRCQERGHAVWVEDFQNLSVRCAFDWVLCIGSLEFVRSPGAALNALRQALSRSGRLVLLFPRRSPLGLLYRAYHRSHGVRIRLFTAGEIDALLCSAGLQRRGAWLHGVLSSAGMATRPAAHAFTLTGGTRAT